MRRSRFLTILTALILLLTFLGFFVSRESRLGEIEIGLTLHGLQRILVGWAVIIAAFAVVLGFLNVLSVHISKLTGGASGWFNSAVLIISAVIVTFLGLGDILIHPEQGLWGPFMAPVFIWVIAPLQAATAALLPFVLTYAAFRMLRLGHRASGSIFLLSSLVVVLGRIPLPNLGVGLEDLRDIWVSWLAVPGLRAVLIGVALGVIMTAWRLILGIDRSQG